eukprot:CAMPEP_0197581072 /NCGR_PEP_ID=MMETSP1326-20131121/4704_1 /TAXON_ID=1155430 /ORGANISM="Genus nov. species nov., Strain RCC2288" /LENGTH=631 /DNA_ID=CAMNT_0043144925 /DNA_START=21 /DNA_END=1916 /DNA_ORIENTATION=+
MKKGGVALEVEPVGHVIWLGSKLPNVKRVFLHRNQELLHDAGWKLKLWRSEDITQQNFPYTYSTIRRALRYHDDSGENVFSMIGDLMKFEILYHFGGLYMDTNIELLRDPTELFTVAASLNKEVFLVADPGGDKRFASAGFMGALKKHSPLFASLIANEQYLNEVPFEEHCIANAWTGPMYLTLKVLHFDSAVILDRDTAYPLLCGQDQKDRCLERVGNDETSGSKVDQKHSVLVKEENGDMWRVKVPCTDIAQEYPEATAVDHFSLGKSWINCKPEVKSQKLVDWTLRYVHDPASFIFDFVMDQVRWSNANNTEKMTKKLVKRRQQLLGAGSNRAQLILLATTARSGSTLMSELMRQAFNADEDTVVWEDESGLHSDIPLYNRFFDLGDLWSENTLKQDWVLKDLKPKLMSFGVKESSFDTILQTPALFVDEVLQKSASAGYQYVLVKVGWNNDPNDSSLAKRVASNLLDSFPHSSVVFLERSNILAQFASLTAAQDTGLWMKFADSLNPADQVVMPPPIKVLFNFPRFKLMFDQRHQWVTFFNEEMDRRQRKYVHLVYEEHLSTQDKQAETMKRLKEFFGFDINVNSNFLKSSVRLVKSAARVPLKERFVNPEDIPSLLTRAFPLDEVE